MEMENDEPDYKELHYVNEVTRALLSINRLLVKDTITRALQAYQLIDVVDKIIVPALEKIGDDWLTDKVSLSQVYMSGKICTDILGEMMTRESVSRKKQPKIAITVLEDFHTLGKQIIKGFLQAAGFALIDYGHGITVNEVVERTINDKIEVLLISVLMLPSALSIKEVQKHLRQRGNQVIIVVGGAPFNFDSELYKEVGADYMGKTVSDAIHIISTISGGKAR